ncbi:MAG TPA: DUF2804 domain-containing protein [Levilinea sp.]|nr:DUF2804 domain-containing protein [Levilinea sp.]
MTEQRLIETAGALLDDQGCLAAVGWSRQPLLDNNLEKAHFYRLRFLQKLRLKRWDYYGITTPTHYYSFTISDIGYLGMVFAYVIEFATGQYHEQTLALPLARGVVLPRNSTAGESLYDDGRVSLRFRIEGDQRRLSINWPGFGGSELSADATLHMPPEHESMVIVIPIKGKRFYYNRKVNCLPVSGWIQYSNARTALHPAACLGNLDWGRGVWDYNSFWVWASASGFLADGRTIGLNMGYGFGDTSAATENALILSGKMHKLAQIDFCYNNQNFKAPWTMRSPDGRLELTFTPFFERVAKTNRILLSSEVHQMFGRYCGTVYADGGELVQIDNLVGWAEEHRARW